MEPDKTMETGKKPSQEEQTCDCGINKKLIVYKLFYFFFLSGIGAFVPYFTMFLKQLWLSASQAGFLFGFYHFCRFIGAPLMSAIADKFKKRQFVLVLSLLSLCIMAVVVSFTPSGIKPAYCNIISKQDELNTTQDQRQDGTETHWNKNFQSETNLVSTTFVCLILALCLGGFMDGPAHSIADTLTLKALQGDHQKYGFQRAFGGFGYGLTSVIVGLLVALNTDESLKCGEKSEGVNYRPCLYTASIMWFGCFISGFGTKENPDETKPIQTTFWFNLKSGLSLNLVAVFLLATYNGFVKGLVDSFLFWHLQSLGGKQTLFSMVKLSHWFAEVIGFLTAEFWIKCIGHLKLLCLSMIGYSLRFLIYGLIANPWLVLTIEWIKALTFCVFLSAGVSYIGLCRGVPATYQGIFTGLLLGLGPSLGPAIGGVALANVGSTHTFFIVSAVSLLVAVLFMVVITFSSDPTSKEVAYSEVDMDESVSHDE